MPFFFVFATFMICFCNITAATFDEQINYFVNKEIYESVLGKDENLSPVSGKMKIRRFLIDFDIL